MKKNVLTKSALRTRQLAVSGLLTALSVVFMWIGAATEVLDLSMLIFTSFCIIFAVIEMGDKWAFLIWGCASVLCFLILPSKSSALLYLLGGSYPIFKSWFEKSRTLFAWILKLSLFNTLQLLFILLAQKVLRLSGAGYEFVLGEILLGNVVFVVFDICLSVCITAYLLRFRRRLKIKNLRQETL